MQYYPINHQLKEYIVKEQIITAAKRFRSTKDSWKWEVVPIGICSSGYVFGVGKIVLEDMAKNLLEHDEVRKAFLGS
jgi:hypothetical protein